MSRQRHVLGHRALVLQRHIGKCRDMSFGMSLMSLPCPVSCLLGPPEDMSLEDIAN